MEGPLATVSLESSPSLGVDRKMASMSDAVVTSSKAAATAAASSITTTPEAKKRLPTMNHHPTPPSSSSKAAKTLVDPLEKFNHRNNNSNNSDEGNNDVNLNRNRVVSLDRNQVLSVGDLYLEQYDSSSSSDSVVKVASWKTKPLRNNNTNRRSNVAEVASSESEDLATRSSDTSDEASYFSGQLPSPKSATRKGYGAAAFPYSRNNNNSNNNNSNNNNSSGGGNFTRNTAVAPLPNYRLATTGDRKQHWQESDASLSFSSCSSDEFLDDDVNMTMNMTAFVASSRDNTDTVPPAAVNLRSGSPKNDLEPAQESGKAVRDIHTLTTTTSFRPVVEDESSMGEGTDDTDDAYSTTDSTHSTQDLKFPEFRPSLNSDQATAWRDGGQRQISDSSNISRGVTHQPTSSSTLQMNNLNLQEDDTDESLNWKMDHLQLPVDLSRGSSHRSNGNIQPSKNKTRRLSSKDAEESLEKRLPDQPHQHQHQLVQVQDVKKKRPILPSRSSNEDLAGISSRKQYTVYWNRWLMLFYMSMLNLLSDWTCYSVAPIAVLTSEAFGEVDPELLVTIFLSANAVSTALEPAILHRLGLRRTVVFGALLLMIGSAVKSGGIPVIMGTSLQKGQGDWRVYLGFFLVGLSQPLYQCTPALLSASWFPEKERTLATGVALNSNQLGIGCAFVFGTLLVSTSDDIPKYFGVLSFIATLTFVGCALQFDDAPPTPPSNTARVMRGTVEINLPYIQNVRDMIGSFKGASLEKKAEPPSNNNNSKPKSRRKPRLEPRNDATRHRRRSHNHPRTALSDNGFRAPPSHASTTQSTREARAAILQLQQHASVLPPSPMWNSTQEPPQQPYNAQRIRNRQSNPSYQRQAIPHSQHQQPYPQQPPQPQPDFNAAYGQPQLLPDYPHPYYQSHPSSSSISINDSEIAPDSPFPNLRGDPTMPQYRNIPAHQHPHPNSYGTMHEQPPYQVYHQYPPPYYPQYAPLHMQQANQMGYQYYAQQQQHLPFAYPMQAHMAQYAFPRSKLPALEDPIDEGAEPVLVQAGHHLDIDIRDDQILLSARACFSRPGFVQSLIAFVVSAIVINTLSTFMDYLVRLGGSGGEMVGIVGGSFQLIIMLSSLMFGQITDRTRAYFSVVLALLVFGAFALAECGVNLDAQRGTGLKWSLIVVAILVGPLQPVATELGVEVAFPLSENTVLVIQQLFANLLSAFFIPCFKAVQNVGRTSTSGSRPQYTFSFYLLIVIHACATVAFATFNGHYLRLAHELEEKEKNQKQITTTHDDHDEDADDDDSSRPMIV